MAKTASLGSGMVAIAGSMEANQRRYLESS